jgi:hypothetical protein
MASHTLPALLIYVPQQIISAQQIVRRSWQRALSDYKFFRADVWPDTQQPTPASSPNKAPEHHHLANLTPARCPVLPWCRFADPSPANAVAGRRLFAYPTPGMVGCHAYAVPHGQHNTRSRTSLKNQTARSLPALQQQTHHQERYAQEKIGRRFPLSLPFVRSPVFARPARDSQQDISPAGNLGSVHTV